MPLTRREMLGFGLAAAILPWPGRAQAKRYANGAGLAPGRFVWEPSQPRSGPVVLVVSHVERLVHVYRDGVLIGISTCHVGSRRAQTGVFLMTRGPERSSTLVRRAVASKPDDRELTWWAKAVFGSVDGRHFQECVRLPAPFARLLSEVAEPGGIVIVADQRTEARTFVRSSTPLMAMSPDHPKLSSRVSARVSTDREHPAVPPAGTVLISRAERQALFLHNGAVEARAAVRFEDPRARLGTHVFVLLQPDAPGEGLRWMGFGVGRSGREPHIADWLGEVALSRIVASSADAAAGPPRWLSPGSTLVVTDAPITLPRRMKPLEFPILAAGPAAPEPRYRQARRTNRREPQPHLWAAFAPHTMR